MLTIALLAGIGIGLWLGMTIFACGGWVRLNKKRDADLANNNHIGEE